MAGTEACPTELLNGTKISHYTILSKLGSGGMGQVFLAQDTKLDRVVALKILPPQFASDPHRMRRFVQEAKAASALDHSNVAHIYEIGEEDGTNFIAMQYIEGQTLDAKIKDRPIESNEILDIAIQASDALDAAGSKGIIHRDIKAANIMITPRGQVKVLDFGLAKIDPRTTSQSDTSKMDTAEGTTPGTIVGTVQYMSPEQALGKPADHRSDIYSLGVVLYQLATARLPFSGTTPSDTLNRILNAQPEAIARFNYNINAELERIIRKCMEKDPERRYQSARELVIDLRNLKRDSESGRQPASHIRKFATHKRFAVMIGVLALAIATIYYVRSATRSEIRSLAVLPFAHSNPDPSNEWLSDGITETTINSLSQIHDLKVMARSTVNRFKGNTADPQKAGKDLKVDAVLTGIVSQQGNNLIIGAELVDVKDGSYIWGGKFSKTVSDLAQMQRDISEEISNELRRKLTGEQIKVISKQFDANPEAYSLYLKGRFFWNKRTADGIRKAIKYFQQAINLDPSFAPAYAGLADSYLVPTSPFSREIRITRGRAAAVNALELDPSSAEAHTSLGAAKDMEWKWKEAEQQYRKAIEMNPNYPTAHQWLGENLASRGRTEEAILEAQKAMQLDPLSTIINMSLAQRYYFARRYDEAISQCRKALELDPDSLVAQLFIFLAMLEKKEFLESLSEYEKFTRMIGSFEKEEQGIKAIREHYFTHGEEGFWKSKLELDLQLLKDGNGSTLGIAGDFAQLREIDAAIAWLGKSIEVRDPGVRWIKVHPTLDPLRSDPRFSEYLRRLNLE